MEYGYILECNIDNKKVGLNKRYDIVRYKL